MNKKFYGIVIASMMLSLISGCTSTTNLKVNEKALSVELGEQVSTKAETYLDKNTDKEVIEKSSVTFNKSKNYIADQKTKTLISKEGNFLPVGNYKATLKYEDEQKNITVKVKDTKAPSFKDFKDEVSIEVGSTVALNTLFTAEDLSEVTITVDQSKLDLTKEGSYEIKVIATDAYKNKVTKKATLKVIAKQVAVETPSQPVSGGSGQTNASNNQGTASAGNTGGSNAGNSATTPPANNNGGTGGSSSGDVCVPQPSANSNGLYSSFDEAVAVAEAFLDSKENSDKYFDDIPGNAAYGYGMFTAGCGYWYVVYDWQ